jgi:uncharacterized membrane protein YphA (DoxX/SURF4 family)
MEISTDLIAHTGLADPAVTASALPAATPIATADAPLEPVTKWSLPTRIGFRFFAIYFTLYILFTQMFSGLFQLPFWQPPSPGANATVQRLVTWIVVSWWGFPQPSPIRSGSGDKPTDFALAAGLLIISALVTLVWSLADRRRRSYVGLNKWFRVFLRFGLGSTMLTYGTIKAFPLQMSYPFLTRLLEPYGNFSLMGVLWAQMGASPAYQIFTGCVEVLAAVLLFIPGLTTVGALVALAATTQVWVLNMTYDVPVKLFSLHLVAMSLMLLAPDLRRLTDFLILRRPATLPTERPLARSRTGRRIAVAAQLVVAGWLLWSGVKDGYEGYQQSGPSAPKPPLYGIWVIDRMTIDGVERAPLVTDYDRWRRFVVQFPTAVHFQRMDDTFSVFQAKVDVPGKNIVLTAATKEVGHLALDQPSPGRLILDGEVNGHRMRMETSYSDRSNFPLVRGDRFRWIQNFPFNR